MPNLGNGAVVEVALMGLTHGPGLQLPRGIAGRVEVVVASDLGEGGAMAAVIPLVEISPGGEVAFGAGLAGGIRGEGNGGHGAPSRLAGREITVDLCGSGYYQNAGIFMAL